MGTMTIKLLDEGEHNNLKEKLEALPTGDRRFRVYGKSLAELYADYVQQLATLEENNINNKILWL